MRSDTSFALFRRPSLVQRFRGCSALFAIACALTGCASQAQPPRAPRPRVVHPPVIAPQATPQPQSLPEATAVARERVALLASGEVIVGNQRGLEAWQPDGSSQRLISPGAALHPRRFGADHVVALRPALGYDVRDGAALELIALETGERRELAQLPAFHCLENPPPIQPKPRFLDVADPNDFEVHPAARVACLGLMDNAWTMASVRVRVRIDLSTRALARWLVVGEEHCTVPPDVQAGDPAQDGVCWAMADVEPPPIDPAAYPFTFDEEHVRMPAAPRGGAKTRLRGYQVERVSPSGRWQLLSGDWTQRDNVYRRLVLLDRNDGKLYPLTGQPGPWPEPLKAAGAGVSVPVRQSRPFANETDVRWIGDSASSELLVLDTILVKPGERAFDVLEGDLAR